MDFFPISIKLDRVLIVGGGRVALSKLEKIIEFTTDIKVISKEFLDEFIEFEKRYKITLIKREYRREDLNGSFVVIVAVDDINLQRRIFYETRDKRILVNSVDSTKYCDFIFSSFIREGDLIISISTNATAPTLAKLLKEYIKSLIPPSTKEFLAEMKTLRATLPKGKRRIELFRKRSIEFFNQNFK